MFLQLYIEAWNTSVHLDINLSFFWTKDNNRLDKKINPCLIKNEHILAVNANAAVTRLI